jgi:hypothetical protein
VQRVPFGSTLSNPILRPKLKVPFQSITSEDAGPVLSANLGQSSGSGSSSLQVSDQQGQNDASTDDLGRSSQPKLSSSSASRLVSGLSPVSVPAPLPSCSNPATLSQEATVELSLPFSFPPSLVTQMFQAIPLVGFGFFGGHGLDAATMPCSSGFVPPPIGVAEIGEKIHSSLPMLQSSKPFKRYYQKARDLVEGQVKWNDGLLVDSMEASKKSGGLCNKASVAEPNSKEDSTEPPLKSFTGTMSNEKKEASNGKKSFLRIGFLNLRPAVLAPSTSLSLPFELAPSSTSEDKEVGVVRDNDITQSQQWLVGFNPFGEVVV